MLPPVRAPVVIAPAKLKLESAHADPVDSFQHAVDESPTRGKLVAHEVRMCVVEPIEQHLEEVGRMDQVLDVD